MAVSIKTAVAIGSGLLVLGAGIGVASAAYADTPGLPNPTTAPTIAPTPDNPAAPAPGNPAAPTPGNPAPQNGAPAWPMSPEQEEVLVKTLSSMLGADEAEVRAALDQVRADYVAKGPAALDPWLDKAVQAGILSQDEADALRRVVEQGGIDLGPR
ncbi:MAG TPA: hypothetical protein VNC63_16015 [Propionibacteriaceae bacterium]|nr:hypothetical protein [Propionibacteriaceae bacterium]